LRLPKSKGANDQKTITKKNEKLTNIPSKIGKSQTYRVEVGNPMSVLERKYERIKKLGEGGFGQVYLYRCKADEQLVVIKEVDTSKLDAKGKQVSSQLAPFSIDC
jgi:serine/threonine protein kinase